MSTTPEAQIALRQAALAAEHAAIYAYGVLAGRLERDDRGIAEQATQAHRARRDALARSLRQRSADAPVAAAAYDVVVAGRPDALALAVRLEEGVGVRWRDLVASTRDPDERGEAVSALTDTAIRAARWRVLLGLRPPTVALPGVLPG